MPAGSSTAWSTASRLNPLFTRFSRLQHLFTLCPAVQRSSTFLLLFILRSSPAVQFQTHEGRTQEKKRTYCIWQKRKPIGCGSFGSVYVAINRKTGEMCATKEVHMFPDDPKSVQTIKQLEQEIEVLSNLKHPNIVQYYGSEIVEDKFYVFLEYVHPGAIRVLTCHIVSGLAYLYSKNIVHRDIKRANLLVDASGFVKLANFGTAKLLIKQIANPDFALAVDIWSLGCTVIELYTGKPPWSDFEGFQTSEGRTREEESLLHFDA